MKFATVVPVAMTALLMLTMSATAVPVPVTAQSSSSASGDPTSFLESAKMHLSEATKDLKMGNWQTALAQMNMTRQSIISAEQLVNASVICNNVNNEGYCVAP
ncbi:MAG TPA: hypothetical protein VFI73_00835 [Candidatus Nitrosopolaris sp.]|nr:hypothetical protein [Candidatus Nitrosopolaris sp.]